MLSDNGIVFDGDCANIDFSEDAYQRVRVVDIHDSELDELPSSITSLDLVSLSISKCHNLTSLPHNLGDLANLKSLGISECDSLNGLPDSIGNLKRLEKLHIFRSGLARLPDSLSGLGNLKLLSISICPDFNYLPISICDIERGFVSVLDIVISSTSLDFIPECIHRIRGIRNLDLNSNMINYIPSNLFDPDSNVSEVNLIGNPGECERFTRVIPAGDVRGYLKGSKLYASVLDSYTDIEY